MNKSSEKTESTFVLRCRARREYAERDFLEGIHWAVEKVTVCALLGGAAVLAAGMTRMPILMH